MEIVFLYFKKDPDPFRMCCIMLPSLHMQGKLYIVAPDKCNVCYFVCIRCVDEFSIRLVGGSFYLEGRVEVYVNGAWQCFS